MIYIHNIPLLDSVFNHWHAEENKHQNPGQGIRAVECERIYRILNKLTRIEAHALRELRLM